MPSAANVTINDGSATPVAYTFAPIQKDEKGVIWFEQVTPSPTNLLGAYRLSYKQVRGASQSDPRLSGVGTCVYALWLPTLETVGTSDSGITPPPTVAYRDVARLAFDLPERGTSAERKNLRAFAFNLLQNAVAVQNIDNLQTTYGV